MFSRKFLLKHDIICTTKDHVVRLPYKVIFCAARSHIVHIIPIQYNTYAVHDTRNNNEFRGRRCGNYVYLPEKPSLCFPCFIINSIEDER